ncbi:MAG: GNAT family N-acetyltransferase [Chlorobium limicola]|uniref:GCN5-related N-acetyltransferase n=1 Tax=Chlorobium limicola (strain DSM 245 / NBRC 103803 / 6330) TaxID=290315 RepID=B3ECN1_CHLL2|nr:GNAT family N-acetyltransferase [Chlorobium limicola]ACD90306.1 GCN5-related N-acetyltransferase [Chlorobium limicola DSM 245]NTV21181.1 GNAT family N-acetyltransferase [Chlorobium limicola]
MQNIELRTAGSDDIVRCAELLGLLFAQEHEFLPDPEAQKRGLELVIDHQETGRVFVCDIDGKVEGMVMLLFTVSTFLGQKVALLEDMIVDPAWRSRGIGTLLLRHAVSFAETEGFGRITLLTDQDNSTAQEFYQRAGFLFSSMRVMRKPVEDL